MVALQVARRQCFNSPTAGASICMYSCHLASLLSLRDLPHIALSSFLCYIKVYFSESLSIRPQLTADMLTGCANGNLDVVVLKVFTGTLTSSIQLACLNYLEFELPNAVQSHNVVITLNNKSAYGSIPDPTLSHCTSRSVYDC